MKKGPVVSVVVMMALFQASSSSQAEGGKITLVTREVSVGRAHSGYVPGTLVVSPDSKRVAYLARRGRKWFVVLDGVEGKEYDEIGEGSLICSPDSKRVQPPT